ncbi:hypothetical protein M9434_001640 [Picochlorum sp. BPE23]|nr:hypothetical protein M9434_001640 [Picochlorum sp. BPE23]
MGGGHRTIRSSKQSTYDPRKARELKKQKTFTIKKSYQKLKKKLNDVKPVNYDSIEEQKDSMKISVDAAAGVDGDRKAGDVPVAEVPDDKDSNKKSRSKQRKQMLKKTKHGQPLMKYRIQKMLDVLQK